MTGRRRPLRLVGVLACVLVVLALACTAPGPATHAGRPPATDGVVVASFNFLESELLAEIYAQALEHVGIPVRRELDLGPRELVRPALHQGLVDVVPEYLGTALAAFAPTAPIAGSQSPEELRRRLASAFAGWNVEVLAPAAAQNQNGLVVTQPTANRLRLRTTSDLVPAAPRLTLGGPAECPDRPYCLPGLAHVYGLRFGRFLPFDTESQRAAAVVQHVVDVVVLFTTDGRLAAGDLVLLADDRHLQPAENVVPMVSARAVARYGPRLAAALDAVSAKLTQQNLIFLNWRVAVAGKDVAAEARGWLIRRGLVPMPG